MEEMLSDHGGNVLAIMVGILFINLAVTVVNIMTELQINELSGLI